MMTISGCMAKRDSKGQTNGGPVEKQTKTAVKPRSAEVHDTWPYSFVLSLLQRHSPEEVVTEQGLQRFSDDLWGRHSNLAFTCLSAGPTGEGEVPVLACQWGPGFNVITGHGLFWYEDEEWHAQPYPDPGGVLKIGGQVYPRPGQPCGGGCGSGFSSLRQGGPLLAVVVNLTQTGTARTEEVHLLRRTGGKWVVVWVPYPGTWPYSHTEVGWPGDGISRLQVFSSSWWREDGINSLFAESNAGLHRYFTQEWVLSGSRYWVVSETEVYDAYSTLVHFVYALATQGDARQWAISPAVINQAQMVGLVPPPRDGFAARQLSWDSFLVFGNSYEGKPKWKVHLVRTGERWVVDGIRSLPDYDGPIIDPFREGTLKLRLDVEAGMESSLLVDRLTSSLLCGRHWDWQHDEEPDPVDCLSANSVFLDTSVAGSHTYEPRFYMESFDPNEWVPADIELIEGLRHDPDVRACVGARLGSPVERVPDVLTLQYFGCH